MLRVLTLSTLFPNEAQPTFGVFVERQAIGLAAQPGVEVQVVAPIGLPPWPLSLHPRYRKLARLPLSETWKGLTVHRPRFPLIPRYGARWTVGLMTRSLKPVLREIRKSFPFDIIDAQFFWPDGPAAMHLAEALNLPFSIKARGADIDHWGSRPGTAGQVLAAGRRADGLLAVSKALRQRMIDLGIPGDKVAVHYTGVDSERFRPLDRTAARAGLGIDGPLLITVGALIPRKGQKLSIAATAEVPRATLMIVGEGPDRGALERFAREAGMEGRVRFLGNRPHGELPTLMAAADVMVLPSSSEGLANAWVESLACGTPVVISDGGGGAHEVIDRPEAGRIVGRDPTAIAAAVREILANPPAPKSVCEAARKFSWEKNGAMLLDHLGRIAGQPRDGRLSH